MKMYWIFTKIFFISSAAWFTILLTRSNHQFRNWMLNFHGFLNQFYLILWNCALCFPYSEVWTVRWQECHQSKMVIHIDEPHCISSVCTKTSCSVTKWLSDSNFSAIFLIHMGQLYSFLNHKLTPHGLSSLLAIYLLRMSFQECHNYSIVMFAEKRSI